MHFVLTLHSHLPWVVNHGRWPHGTDWLREAAVGTYLPLLETLEELRDEGIPAPVSVGLTPVLANQLAHPTFPLELESFLRQRIRACEEAPTSLRAAGSEELIPLAGWWKNRFRGLLNRFLSRDGDVLGAFRALQERGRLETISSAATHGLLPLLAREESIRLQLHVGRAEHRRLLGREPQGCWLPESAYDPGGSWSPTPEISGVGVRPSLARLLSEVGYRYFIIDAHMVGADLPPFTYGVGGDRSLDARRGPGGRQKGAVESTPPGGSPHRAFRVPSASGAPVAALVREPRATSQVWSRHHGYPGDGAYLEFHKILWPGGLRLWRVTDKEKSLGEKEPYDPQEARSRARTHARHFAGLLDRIRRDADLGPSGVAVAPFDTELFGHWWFEGVEFLGRLFRALPEEPGVITVSASEHLDSFPPQTTLEPLAGSCGAGGDFSMWLNADTRWTWERLWPLEAAFREVAPKALGRADREEILAHATRQLLLAQSSDWQFMITTGEVPDYAERRFALHCNDLELLLPALDPAANAEEIREARARAAVLAQRDDLFPAVLDSLRKVVSPS